MKTYNLNMTISAKEDISQDEILDNLVKFAETNDYLVGGGLQELGEEDMADEILDEDDIKEMALDYIINTGGLPKTIEEWQNALWKFYESLTKKD